MGLWTCWHIHISLLICLCFSPLTDGLVVSISPLLSILSETGCHRHHLRTMLFLFSILHSFLFPLFLSKRRCLWLATSTWLIKKAVRLTWRWRNTCVSSWLCTCFWQEHNVSRLLWMSYTQVCIPLTEQVARCAVIMYNRTCVVWRHWILLME